MCASRFLPICLLLQYPPDQLRQDALYCRLQVGTQRQGAAIYPFYLALCLYDQGALLWGPFWLVHDAASFWLSTLHTATCKKVFAACCILPVASKSVLMCSSVVSTSLTSGSVAAQRFVSGKKPSSIQMILLVGYLRR